MKKQVLFTILAMLVSVSAFSYDIEVANADGVTIYYNYMNDGTELAVTYRGSKYGSYQGNVVIPASVSYSGKTYPVTSIGNEAFRDCSGLTSITIPNSVKSIGGYAFNGCKSLTSVTIPNSVTSIRDDAFNSCSGLTSVTIGNSVTSIGERAFEKCSGLTSVTIGNSVTSIRDDAFRNCSGLKKVIVKDIAAWCGIKFNTYSSNPLYYAKHLYSDEDTEITNLIIPNSVTSIGWSAFSGCSGITSVTIGNSVTSIGNEAFRDCSGLTSVTIPNSVTSIGRYAFEYCSGLTSVTIGNRVTSIGYQAFEGCSGLTSVTIPNSVTSIGERAFSGCTNMITAVIGFGIDKILTNTFYGCTSLKRVVLPTPISSIGKDAFNGCSDLEEVICLARRSPECDGNVFSGVNFYNCKLMVLEDKIKVYEEAPVWQNFFNIVACDPNNIPEYKNSDNNPDVNGDGIVDTQDVLEIYKYMQEH